MAYAIGQKAVSNMGSSSQPPSPLILRFAEFTLDLGRRILDRKGETQDLPEEYMNALILLIERRPNTVSKDELCKVLQSTAQTLPKQIEIIRNALGDHTEPRRFIKVERKQGYRFIAAPDEEPPASKHQA